MRRYTSLLLTAFLLFLIVVAGSAYMAGAGRDAERRPMREITAYTTLPAEHAAILSAAYEQEYDIRINFVPLSSEAVLERLREQADSSEGNEGAALEDLRHDFEQCIDALGLRVDDNPLEAAKFKAVASLDFGYFHSLPPSHSAIDDILRNLPDLDSLLFGLGQFAAESHLSQQFKPLLLIRGSVHRGTHGKDHSFALFFAHALKCLKIAHRNHPSQP